MNRITIFSLLLIFLAQFSMAATPVAPKSVPTNDQVYVQNEVIFTSSFDHSEQSYVELAPPKQKNKNKQEYVDVLIALHGHGADRWQYINDKRNECRATRDMAKKYGMILISPDYRKRTSWMGPAAEADMLQIIHDLKKKYKVRHVFLSGASMGGSSTLIFAALHPNLLSGIMSSNGTANMLKYENFQKAIKASYGGDKITATEEYTKRSPELMPKKFTMPMAVTLGGKDTSVPPDSARRLVKNLQKLGKKDILLFDREKMGHSSSYDDTVAAFEFIFKHAGVK